MASIWLILAFAGTALIYSSVGFGGGSTYTALLVMSGMAVQLVPMVSLVCNLLVTSVGSLRAFRAGLLRQTGIVGILACSVPAAFLGGRTPVSDRTLLLLLGCMLLLSGLLLGLSVLRKPSEREQRADRQRAVWAALGIGAAVGYVSGIVGIGGGIFLAPVLHGLKWAPARKIGAMASVYIAANSLAGLSGKLSALPKGPDTWPHLFSYWPLFLAVILGSFIGHRLLLGVFPERIIKGVTAMLIITVAVRILMTAM